MFWNKATPIDHKEDVCCLCGKNVVTRCKITGLRFRHTRDDCIEYLTGRIDYFGRQANCQASDHEDRICELKRENESQLHAICILDSQISKLENANKDISSLLRKASEKLDTALLRIESLELVVGGLEFIKTGTMSLDRIIQNKRDIARLSEKLDTLTEGAALNIEQQESKPKLKPRPKGKDK